MKSIQRAFFGLLASALVLSACGHDHDHDHGAAVEDLAPPETTTAQQGRPVEVVVSTTPIGDVVNQIVACAGEGNVTVLMPVGADPHDYSLSSAQVASLVSADLVITNGLLFESGMESALAGAKNDGARIYEVAPRLDPIPFAGHDHHDHGKKDDHDDHDDHDHGKKDDHDDHDDHDHGKKDDHDDHDDHDHGHSHGELDPHFWLDMNRMATAATLIATELGVVTGDPDTYEACGAQVASGITSAEATVRATLEAIPADRRVIITDHDAFGYFAELYGFDVAGTVIPSGTTLAAPSSADLAGLAGVIRDSQIDVIFANVAQPTQLADALAAEVGGSVQVVPLFVESLGEPGSGAETYVGMMTTNANLIAESLKN